MHGPLAYPRAPRSTQIDRFFGVDVADPFRPLEDASHPDVAGWLAAEASLTRRWLDALPGRDALRTRVGELLAVRRVTGFSARAGRVATTENDGTREQDVLALDGTVVFDPLSIGPDASIAGVSLSPSARYLAFGVSRAGSDWQTWTVRDLEGGHAERTLGPVKFPDPQWLPDESGFVFGAWPEPSERPLEALNVGHRLALWRLDGTREIVAEADHPRTVHFAHVCADGRIVVGRVRGSAGHTALFLRVGERLRPLLGDFDGRHWVVGDRDGRLWVWTDRGAPNGQVLSLALDDPDDVRTEVAETADAIQLVHRARSALVVVRLHRAAARLTVGDRQVALPRHSSIQLLDGDPDRDEAWILLDRFDAPPELLRVDTATATAGRGALGTGVAVRKGTCESADGTPVEFFVVGSPGDRPRRTVLYGYGGFNVPMTPRYSAAIHSWVEQGGLFVMANLRGGSEGGQTWHQAGTRASKERVFEDFVAVARSLVEGGWTTPDRLAIQGRSNGGLLVGACLARQPELFGAALPAVGVMDMLRYHRFTVGALWGEEYGTADEADLFPVLLRYSPLHNLRDGVRYPPTLISTGDHDDRVVPLHSFKFAARLQEAQGGDGPILLRVEESIGHGLGSTRSQMIARVVDEWSFLDAVLAR
jgi:prolyl oligopeptidase